MPGSRSWRRSRQGENCFTTGTRDELLEWNWNFSAFKVGSFYTFGFKTERGLWNRQGPLVIRMMLWSLPLSLKILILLLTLSLISCAKTSPIEQPFAGNFATKTIRELWQMCSISHQRAKVPERIYYPICDCAVNYMRGHFENETFLKEADKKTSDELSVLIRLNCNNFKLNGTITN